MSSIDTRTEELALGIRKEVHIAAPLDLCFGALLEQLGPRNQRPDGEPMPMTLEAWPGGRWFRDLGDSNGHLWGHVQVIKRPALLEIYGPLFMSYAALSHVQYRLRSAGGATDLVLTHRAIGGVEPEHREGIEPGWASTLDRVRTHAERLCSKETSRG